MKRNPKDEWNARMMKQKPRKSAVQKCQDQLIADRVSFLDKEIEKEAANERKG